MAYHDQPLQYINRYYFQTKASGDDNYDIVFIMITMMGVLPFGLWVGFTILSFFSIYPKLNTLLISLTLAKFREADDLKKNLEKAAKENNNLTVTKDKNESDMYLIKFSNNSASNDNNEHYAKVEEMIKHSVYVEEVKHEKSYKINLSDKNKFKFDSQSLFILSLICSIALITFHLYSIIEIGKYAKDVLQTDEYDENDNDIASPIATGTISLIIIAFTYVVTLIKLIYQRDSFDCKSFVVSNPKALNFISLAAVSITLNILHLVCYFMPYMLLAFYIIHCKRLSLI